MGIRYSLVALHTGKDLQAIAELVCKQLDCG